MLKNGIFRPGTKIQLLEPGSGLPANSIGYVIGISNGPSRNNQIGLSTYITRRGKAGRPRLEQRRILVPTLVYVGTERKQEEFYDIISKMAPDVTRCVEVAEINLLKLSVVDFLAWTLSKFDYLMRCQDMYKDIATPYVRENKFPYITNLRKYRACVNSETIPELEELFDTESRLQVIEDIRFIQARLVRCTRMGDLVRNGYRQRSAQDLLKIKRQHKVLKCCTLKELNSIIKGHQNV